MLRKPDCEISQIVNRIHEKKGLKAPKQRETFPSLKVVHTSGPLMNDMNPSEVIQYKALTLQNFSIKIDRRNYGK